MCYQRSGKSEKNDLGFDDTLPMESQFDIRGAATGTRLKPAAARKGRFDGSNGTEMDRTKFIGQADDGPAVVGDAVEGGSISAGRSKQFCRTFLRDERWPHIGNIVNMLLLMYIQMYT